MQLLSMQGSAQAPPYSKWRDRDFPQGSGNNSTLGLRCYRTGWAPIWHKL